jgi:altronate dehydratase
MNTIPFDSAARVPMTGDNVAIAVRALQPGVVITRGDGSFTLPHSVMEGHRFVLEPIARGESLLSFGLPFGTATRDLAPGEYVCNQSILDVLAERSVDLRLPEAPNFEDSLQPYHLDEDTFVPGEQVAPAAEAGSFMGYPRAGGRGVGTRNVVVILGTTARSAAFARAVAQRFEGATARHPGIDGVVAIEHTEGSGTATPNNLDFVLRTLAGFMVHPNVAAVLAVEHGRGAFGNQEVKAYLAEHAYPLEHVPHAFMTVAGPLDPPLSALKIALQCGGSDAFSGVSGNALAGWVAKEIIRRGGSANLAETDELIGAEPYVLSNVRDVDTARRFLEKIQIFKQRAANHGASAEGNPSGGNKFRGLYNIALKSIGAARKLDPEVRLDHVIDYGAPMHEGGYYFMDSPGNDLESIAGQVASGCNLIFFITGNGSITNFPFVPTLKFVTTTGRFEMLRNEMDVNAGRYNDGLPMEELGVETFELARAVAGGQRSKGELAGHAQVQIWRDWLQKDPLQVELIRATPEPDGRPLAVRSSPPSALRFSALRTARGISCDQVGLVMPTSLCSGQVARVVAQELDREPAALHPGISRFVSLVHTEGCGSANADELFMRTLCGHLRHGFVRRAVLLEHGCEKTHNDAIRHFMHEHGVPADRLGFASVQLDGGMAAVTEKIRSWFHDALAQEAPAQEEDVGVSHLRIAMLASGNLPDHAAESLALLARALVAGGAMVVLPDSGVLAGSRHLRETLLSPEAGWQASLAYGEAAPGPGLHLMACPTEAPVEIITGLGGTGAEVMLAHVGDAPLTGHPMVPLLQVASDGDTVSRFGDDLDLHLDPAEPAARSAERLAARIGEVASRHYRPRLYDSGINGFQLTRGLLGISM